MKKPISNEETRRHVQRAVDLFFNSLPKEKKQALSDKEEEWVKCTCGSQTKPKGGTVELAGIIHSEEKPCYKEEHIHTKECMKGVENAVNNLKSVTNCAVCTGKLKEDVCFHCGGTGIHTYEEPKQEACKTLSCPASGYHTHEPKQSTSLKEEIVNLMDKNSSWEGMSEDIMEIVTDKILSLIQSYLVEEIEEQGKRVAPENYDIYQARQDIIKIINALK